MPAIGKVLAVRVSPMFTAILDYILGDGHPRTSPSLTALAVTRDGFLVGWNTAHPHKEGFLGSASDLDRNLKGVCEALGLDEAETKTVVDAAWIKIADWRTFGRRGCSPYKVTL